MCTKLKGVVTDEMLRSVQKDLDHYLDGSAPMDWILDFMGINGVDGQSNEALRTVFGAFKTHANGRHVVVIVNDATRLLVTSSCFGANVGAAVVETLEKAVGEMARRRTETA